MASLAFDSKRARKRKLKLDVIRLDGDTQPRSELNQSVINDYAEKYKTGDKLPPVHVIHDGSSFWLVDGFHRRFATDKTGLKTMECLVLPGTLEDARWMSYAANQSNGLYRSVEDKVRAVKAALAHPNAAAMSDVLIAEHVGVSQPMVLKYRQLITVISSADGDDQPKRKGKDGKSRTGKKSPKQTPLPHPIPPVIEDIQEDEDDSPEQTNDVCGSVKDDILKFCGSLLTKYDKLTPALLSAILESTAQVILRS